MERSLSISETQLKEALEIARTEYQNEISRFRDLDNKLNMMLVLAVGILAALGIIVSSSVATANVCVKILLGIISGLILAVVIIIVIGLFPQRYNAPDIQALASKNNYTKDDIEFLGSYISAYSNNCYGRIKMEEIN